MKAPLLLLTITLCLLLHATLAAKIVSYTALPTQSPRDFQLFSKLLPGHYDNILQYEDDISRGLPPNQRHVRYETQINNEEVPLFPKRTHFYLEQFTNGDKSQVVRQSLYSIATDPLRPWDIYTKIYSFVDPGKFLHAPAFSPLFEELKMEELEYREGCDVIWTRKELWPPRFGSRMEGDCFFDDQGVKVRIDDNNNITFSALTNFEKWYAPNGTEILNVSSPYVMLRQWEPQLSTNQLPDNKTTQILANQKSDNKTTRVLANRPLRFKSWLSK